ncbi:unnamed protein product [Paramecium octaurelia]|uniref:Potassium channel domain-containing protein n=1 Tax=Paramecium octaurelia TaxID=43137 RepID=A0A8S1V9C1_PAROT|nr:unnamed protein product [Paramecium octaurelia]
MFTVINQKLGLTKSVFIEINYKLLYKNVKSKLWSFLKIKTIIKAQFKIKMIIGYFMQMTMVNQCEVPPQKLSLLRLVRFMRFIKIIRLLRQAKLKIFFDKIEDAAQLNIMLSTIVSLIKLSGLLLFWSHWFGCILHYIAVNEDSQINWLNYYGIYEEGWSVEYINSLYWAVITISTVGYGDISPRTPLERLFRIFFLMIATVVFSVTLNNISYIIIRNGRQQG